MSLFVFYGIDHDGMGETRIRVRPEHRAYITQPAPDCRVVAAGPLTDDEGVRSTGSLIILDAESREAAERFLAGDPFAKAGIFATTELRAWTFGIGPGLSH